MRDKKGFTLIEITAVMILLGFFLLVAIPKFMDFNDVNIKSTSRRIAGIIKYLYNEAVFKKKIYRLSFDLDNEEYWVEVQEGNGFEISNDPLLKKRKLPEGLSFKDVLTDRSRVNSLGENEQFILFLPTGFVEPAVIHLESDDGKYYTLATKPYTGGTTVFDEYVDVLNK
jgi:prepilin-type N-terminal cleavage/methylation domain-containing protein